MLNLAVQFPSGSTVSVKFAVVREEDFIREVPVEDFGRIYPQRVNQCPKLRERRVQGWGFIKGTDGRGFNVLLVERPNEVYGEFFAMFNKTGFFATGHHRAEPFAFELGQLEDGVRMIGVMNKYHSDVKPFDSDVYAEFVSEYV